MPEKTCIMHEKARFLLENSCVLYEKMALE
jgi:hypothetical protein